MVGTRGRVLIALGSGIPLGLVTGVLEGWGHDPLLAAVVFGSLNGAFAWFSPAEPEGVDEDVWDALSRSQKRTVVTALARGQSLSGIVSPFLADQIANSVAD